MTLQLNLDLLISMSAVEIWRVWLISCFLIALRDFIAKLNDSRFEGKPLEINRQIVRWIQGFAFRFS